MRTTFVEISNLNKQFSQHQVLDQLNLTIHAGEIVAILGENGAGKTTLLNIMLGLLPADSGEVQLFGRPVSDLKQSMPLRGNIGVMLQQASLPGNLTVQEHLQLFSCYYPNPRPLPELIQSCGLSDIVHQRFSSLSGGQKQAVLFALAIVGKPVLLFLDEPTVGLDVAARQAFWQQIRQAKADGISVVLTTHYLEEADQLASRILVLKNGQFIADGSPAALKALNQTRQLCCSTRLATSLIQSWPEVQQVVVFETAEKTDAEALQQLQIQSLQPEQTLRRMLALDEQLSDLTVSGVSLEQAFLQLTQHKEHSA
ncbi:MAG: ABC transporter ATP-binding protein [Gammaproteobacteria bacterium]|nr:ABC transporter ATP-binding protein [Gammaproteobacteria bacterium]MBU2280555.1 ABC transporter ATP-binding protein [Gammaproteobacteria bacterium]